jgi:hypothetical protein
VLTGLQSPDGKIVVNLDMSGWEDMESVPPGSQIQRLSARASWFWIVFSKISIYIYYQCEGR